MKTLLLDSGIIPFDKAEHAVRRFIITNKLITIQHPHPKSWQPERTRLDTYSYYDMEAVEADSLSNEVQDKYNKCLHTILNDLRTVMIAERIYETKGWQSLFLHSQSIEKQIFNSLRFLEKIKPDFFLLQATPHDIRQWTMAKTAEFLNIPVIMFQRSPLPWRTWLVKGIDKLEILHLKNLERINISDKKEKELLARYISINNSSYKSALPSYEQKKIIARGGKFWSWKKEVKDVLEHPSLLSKLYFKRKLFNSYNKLARHIPLENVHAITLFLHFQPERSSLPEGGLYAQQWLIVRNIAMLLPPDWILLVKEHPSTFMGRYRRDYRSPQFYSDIASLPNVRLVSIEEDTFYLIDRSIAIATITGMVGIQALIRGKPVLVFGTASYRGAMGAFTIENLKDLRNALREIQTFENNEISLKTREFLVENLKISISGIDPENLTTIDPPTFDFFDDNIRLTSHARLLAHFLEHFEANEKL